MQQLFAVAFLSLSLSCKQAYFPETDSMVWTIEGEEAEMIRILRPEGPIPHLSELQLSRSDSSREETLHLYYSWRTVDPTHWQHFQYLGMTAAMPETIALPGGFELEPLGQIKFLANQASVQLRIDLAMAYPEMYLLAKGQNGRSSVGLSLQFRRQDAAEVPQVVNFRP
ncbi:MAG: hypothetical protein AAF433_21480 [Bacteroidota bacterium]